MTSAVRTKWCQRKVPPRFWTEEDSKLAHELFTAGFKGNAIYQKKLGRSYEAVKAHIRYAKKRKTRPGFRLKKDKVDRAALNKRSHVVVDCYRPSQIMMDEAFRRNHAERSLTAEIFGDPPLGYSALDRKNA